MNILSPCKECERSGCGAYHDECPDFAIFREKVEQYRDAKEEYRQRRKHPVKAIPNKSGLMWRKKYANG